MPGKKLGAAGPVSDPRSGRPVLDMLFEHNEAVAGGLFDKDAQLSMPMDRRLGLWERTFEIMARADELPPWASKPSLTEQDGWISPTVGGPERSVSGRTLERKELRQAVDLMRSSAGPGKTLSREEMVRRAERSLGTAGLSEERPGLSGPDV